MIIGRPVEVSIKRLDDGEICAELYDDAGFCCGGLSVFPDGSAAASLLAGNNKTISRDKLEATSIAKETSE